MIIRLLRTSGSRRIPRRRQSLLLPRFYRAGVAGTAIIVASMVATTFSLLPLMAKASAVQMMSVCPALFTCALASKNSPTAGARRFTLNSTVRTSLSPGSTLKAA